MAHIRLSRSDSGLGFCVKALQPFLSFPLFAKTRTRKLQTPEEYRETMAGTVRGTSLIRNRPPPRATIGP